MVQSSRGEIVSRCKHGTIAEFCRACMGASAEFALRLSTRHWASKRRDLTPDVLAKQVASELSEAERMEMLRRLLKEQFAAHRDEDAGEVRTTSAEKATQRRREERGEERSRSATWKPPLAKTAAYQRWRKMTSEQQAEARAEQDEEFAAFFHDESWPHGYDEAAFRSWKVQQCIAEFTEHVRQEARLELTDELLSAEFGLEDGTSVTWADATAEQHEARARVLIGYAGEGVTLAKRHEAALDLLADHQVATLGDIRSSAVV